jgi:Fanconi anemia group M protein
MTVIVDTREQELIKLLRTKKDLGLEEDFIEVGDLLLPEGFVIERKTEKDFIASILDKRLFNQLNNLVQYENPMIAVIHDDLWKNFYFCRNRYIHNVYIGVLSTIAASYPKVKMQYFYDTNQFVDYIVSLHKKLTEEGKGSRPKILMRKPTSIQERKENALTAVEGIGVATAQKLLDKFGSVVKVGLATEEELKEVLGEKNIKHVKETLN